MTRTELARAIHSSSHLEGEFRLRSGIVADYYFDKYRFEADPRLLRAIAEALVPLVPPKTEALAGLELGGVPIATVLSQLTGLPCFFVRKQAKKHGLGRRIEGGFAPGQAVALVEDTTTTGGSTLDAVAAVQEEGGKVARVLCLVDRGEGAEEAFAEAGLRLEAVFSRSDLPV